MQNVTLEQLMSRTRSACDMDDTELISDTFLINRVNANLAELHDMLVNSFERFFIDRDIDEWLEADPVEDRLHFELPQDFYKLVRVAVEDTNGDFVEINHANTLEDVLNVTDTVTYNTLLKYELEGNTISFYNVPVPGRFFVEYISTFKYLEDPLDEVHWNIPVGWENYVIYKTCADCMAKEESDPTYWLQRAGEAKQMILEHTFRRDADFQSTWSDVTGYIDYEDYMSW